MPTKRGNGEGSIGLYKGRWTARLTLPDGRRKAIYGQTRAEVARKLAAAVRDRDVGLDVSPDKVTVAGYLHRWLEESVKPTNRPSTYLSYEGHVRMHLVPAFGSLRLSELTPQLVDGMMAKKLEAGLSPATVVRIRATLRRALNRAVKQGLVHRNVAALADPPKVTTKPVAPLTPAMAQDLLTAIRGHRLEALFVLALATGLRQGEMLGLQWSDIDLDVRRVIVRNALQRIDGKYVLVPPKTERSRRTLSLPTTTVKMLSEHRDRQKAERAVAGNDWFESNFVFTTDKGRPLDGVNVTHAFQRLVKAAGLPHMRFHELRHACASFLLAQGASMRLVMEQLGHSQIGLTMNTYSHIMPEALEEAASMMEQVLSPRSQSMALETE